MIDSRIASLTPDQRQQLSSLLDESYPDSKPTASRQQLVAWVRSGGGISDAEIRRKAETLLPAAAVPRQFVMVDEIPRSANGKVDRRKLAQTPTNPRTSPQTGEASLTEATLRRIWSHVLTTDDFGHEDHFFEIGGDSLGAIRMIALAQEAGLAVSLGMLNEHRGLRALAIAVDSQDNPVSTILATAKPEADTSDAEPPRRDVAPQYRRAVEDGEVRGPMQLTQRDDLPPLILIPPQGYLVSHLWGIVVHLRRYSAWAPVANPERELASQTIEELAAEYLPQIREIQPHGPYRLAGYCEGAYAAWELARILKSAGEEVRFVGLIDTPNPDGLRPVRETFRERTTRRLKHFQGQKPVEVVMHFAKRSVDWLRRRFRRAVTGERHLTRGGKRTAWLFRPSDYDGHATLFRVLNQVNGEPSAFETDVSYGWADLAKQGLDICYVPGDRMDFTSSPHVEVMAERIEDAAMHKDQRAEAGGAQR